jgi:hypothetical protein
MAESLQRAFKTSEKTTARRKTEHVDLVAIAKNALSKPARNQTPTNQEDL